ncbi:MAG: alpha/beta fold hydrolase [Acidimicrobiales bacterium]
MRTVTLEASDNLTLTADEWGERSGPGVLMLHGAGQNRHAWKNTAAALSNDGWFVLTVDARGHGDSDWSTAKRYDFTHTAADVMALLPRFEQPPVVIGASMGGMSALAAQELFGDGPLFRALVLVDIAPNFALDGAMRIVNWMAANPDGFASLEDASDAMATYNPNRPRPKDLSGLTRVLRQDEDGRWHWRWDPSYITSKRGYGDGDEEAMRQRMAEASEQMMNGARKVEAPLLLVRGGKSDLVTPESAQQFLDAVPGTEFVDVAGTGHMVAGDDNDAFTTAVMQFLDRVKQT